MNCMNRALLLLSVLTFVGAAPAIAQTQSNTVVGIIRVKVKPGQEQQWEAAFKRFRAWEHQHNYPYTSYAWSIVAGKDTGQYTFGTFGHAWKDFDSMDQFESKNGTGAEVQATFAPYTESGEVSFYEFEPDLSVTPPDPPAQPPPLSEVVFFTLKPGSMPAVTSAIKQVVAAEKKTNWPGAKSLEWYELVDGEGAQLVLTIGHQDWADFQGPTPSLPAMLTEVYGKAGANALFHEFEKHVVSESSEVIRYRPDLSYIAAKQ